MLSSFPVSLLAAAALGFLSGLGIGGGSLLMLWLTLVLGMEPEQARVLNLLFFLPAAAASSLFRRGQGTLRRDLILPAALCGCISAGIVGTAAADMAPDLLRKLFGILLLVAGLREMRYLLRKDR